jgi:hypothetical protein
MTRVAAPRRPGATALPRLTLVRVGKNEALAAAECGSADEWLCLRCECQGERCRETVELTRSDYAFVRRERGSFLVAPGHQIAGARLRAKLRGAFVLRRDSPRRRA